MKKTELKIGNYIQYGNPIHKNLPVLMVSAVWADLLWLSDGSHVSHDNSNVIGLPLSDLLLSSCGFLKDERTDRDGDKYTVYFKNGIDIYDHRECGGGFAYATYVKGEGMYKAGFTISTLHQLQNFYSALAGEDLQPFANVPII